MSDYPLTSTWAEVDAAAQAVKNGLPKANLSGAVQASLDKADGAVQVGDQATKTPSMTQAVGVDSSGKLWVDSSTSVVCEISLDDDEYVCDVSFSDLANALAAHSVIECKTPEGLAFCQGFKGTNYYLITFTVQSASGTDLSLIQYRYDEDGSIERKVFSASALTDEIKTALLACFAHVGWDNETDGEAYYTDLFNVLFPTASPVSVSAVYTQSGTVYPFYSLDQLKSDLVVTVHYSDSTSAVTNVYTLSGTLTEGTSTITVTYGALTTTFNVTVTASPVPVGHTPLQYVERPTDAAANTCYNSTGFTPNGTDDLVVKMTVELLAAPSSSSGGYFLACRQNNSGNTLGFGIYVPQDATSIGTFDGESCMIEPEGAGVSIIGKKYSLTVTKTPTTITVTDGTHTNTITRTPRTMANALSVFGLISTSSKLNVPVCGRIHELEIIEGGVTKVKFVPDRRNNDNAVGFWNPVSSEFKTAAYTAGPVL